MIKQMMVLNKFSNHFFVEIKTDLETTMKCSNFIFICLDLLH